LYDHETIPTCCSSFAASLYLRNAAPSTFVNHEPSEIRILKLFPGYFDDPIRCELEHMSLEAKDRLPFAALSYCWGDPNETEPILLDGHHHRVTANLFSFLQHAQSILSAITRYLPRELQQPHRESVAAQLIVYSILGDYKNFLATSHQ
jgi:hypothetical protein